MGNVESKPKEGEEKGPDGEASSPKPAKAKKPAHDVVFVDDDPEEIQKSVATLNKLVMIGATVQTLVIIISDLNY